MKNTKLGHVTPAGANIFADLGFEPGEAVRLLDESNKIILEKLSIKKSLMTESGLRPPIVPAQSIR